MFKNILYLFLAAILFTSCEKNALQLPIDAITSGARVKLIHAAPDITGIDLYIGSNKFSAFTPTGATTTFGGTPAGVPYNNTFPGNASNYAIVTPGATSLSISAPAATTAASATAIGSQNITFEDNKYYSVFVAGAGARPEIFSLTDDFTQATDPNKYYVRFINLTTGQNYDMGLSNGTILAPNLAYKAVTGFIAVDVSITPSFVFRLPGTTTNIGTITFTNSIAGRVITVFTRGGLGRTGTPAPGINFYTNR